jgi:hypothetical protein
MAKHYVVEKSQTTGWWRWYCDDSDPLVVHEARSRREARRAARENCKGEGVVVPPAVDMKYEHGYLAVFAARSLGGVMQKFSVGEINETTFDYIFGYHDILMEELKQEDIVIGILKIWGLYQGGITQIQIMKNHNLSKEDFANLVSKKWYGLIIDIDDYGTIYWQFPLAV